MRKILHLRPSNAKDFNWGYRNPKHFRSCGSADTILPKDFDQGRRNAKYFAFEGVCADSCACADSCVLTLVCVRRLEPWNPWLLCFVTDRLLVITAFHPLTGTSPTALQPCWFTDLYRTNKTMRKYKGDTSIENQLKVDKLDQNRLQSIEKIQNLLHFTLLKLSSSLHDR
jgi:hypothetical protein